MADYDISKAFKVIEDDLIGSMIRNLDHHRAMETDEGIQWTQWQVQQLKMLERYKQTNAKKFGKQFNSINNQIANVLTQMQEKGGFDQEQYILKAIQNGFKGYKHLADGSIQGEFFGINDNKLQALINATTNDMKKAETAVLRLADDQYRKAIFNAQIYAQTGGTYAKAVDMATKDMLRAGLNCVEYKNGARHTLSSYAEMALRTAGTRAYLQGEGEKRKEWGIHTVILNQRTCPCPLCFPFVGKVFVDDVWSGGTPEEAQELGYPLLSEAIAEGLYHPNCKDIHTTYFEGITSKNKPTASEKQRAIEEHSQQQKANYSQNQADKYRRMSTYSLDEDNKRIYKARANEWEEKEKNFFSESRRNKPKEKSALVNIDDINSPEYRRKISGIESDTKISRVLFNRMRDMLEHRTGTEYEDLAFINSVTCKYLVRTDYNVKKQCIPSKNMISMVKTAKPNTIIAIHNHPNSSVPSLDDINSAWKKKYKYGIIACHNGNLYKYKINGEYDGTEVDFLLDKLNRVIYNNNRNYEKIADVLEELKVNNIEMEVFLWK